MTTTEDALTPARRQAARRERLRHSIRDGHLGAKRLERGPSRSTLAVMVAEGLNESVVVAWMERGTRWLKTSSDRVFRWDAASGRWQERPEVSMDCV